MKTRFLILCLLLLTINCSSITFEEDCSSVEDPSDTKDCTSKNSDTEPDKYCCLAEIKLKKKPDTGDQEGKYCDAITKDVYDNIKEYVKTQKEYYKSMNLELSKYKIHCQSAFLKIGLVSLIIGLLF